MSQELKPDEIIILDDASSDGSLSLISQLAAGRPFVEVHANPRNMGVVWCLQRGLEMARGKHVYFAAADDWVLPGFFALGVRMLERYPSVGLFCADAALIDANTGAFLGFRPAVRPRWRAGSVPPDRARRLLRKADNWILTGSTIFRRDAVIEAGGFHEELTSLADGYIARKIALTHGLCYAPRVVASWCINPASFSRLSALDPGRATAMLESARLHFAADPIFPVWYPELFADRWRFAVSRLALLSDPIERGLIISLAGRSTLDSIVLQRLISLQPIAFARLASLTWLWFRLRPYSLSRLLETAVARWLERIIGVRGTIDVRAFPLH